MLASGRAGLLGGFSLVSKLEVCVFPSNGSGRLSYAARPLGIRIIRDGFYSFFFALSSGDQTGEVVGKRVDWTTSYVTRRQRLAWL